MGCHKRSAQREIHSNSGLPQKEEKSPTFFPFRFLKKSLKTNDNEDINIQNLWHGAKAVLRGKFIVIQAFLQNKEKSHTDNSNHRERNEEKLTSWRLNEMLLKKQ